MKLFIRIFLSICIFLLNGYSHLKATTPRDHTSLATSRMIQFTVIDRAELNIRNNPPTFERLNLKFTETDNEDDTDETSGFKKHLTLISNNFSTVFSPLSTDYPNPYSFFNSNNTAQYLYLRIGVLRIWYIISNQPIYCSSLPRPLDTEVYCHLHNT